MKVIEQYEIMREWTEDTPIIMDSEDSVFKWAEIPEEIKESDREIIAVRVKNKIKEVVII